MSSYRYQGLESMPWLVLDHVTFHVVVLQGIHVLHRQLSNPSSAVVPTGLPGLTLYPFSAVVPKGLCKLTPYLSSFVVLTSLPKLTPYPSSAVVPQTKTISLLFRSTVGLP